MASANSVLVNTDRIIESCPKRYSMQDSNKEDSWLVFETVYRCQENQYLSYKSKWDLTDRHCRHCKWLYNFSSRNSSNKFEKIIRS